MKIHRIEEGDCMRWGLNIGRGYIGIKLSRRLHLKLDLLSVHWVSWWLDLRRDHLMYRPPDADKPYLFCRRCGLSTIEAESYCSGKTYRRKP